MQAAVESVPDYPTQNKVQKDPMKDFFRRYEQRNKPDYRRDSHEDLRNRRLVHKHRDPSFNRFLLLRLTNHHGHR